MARWSFTSVGRLVAAAFDDVALIAKTPAEAQMLLHHAQYYYTAASATRCAPKSVWTGTKAPVQEPQILGRLICGCTSWPRLQITRLSKVIVACGGESGQRLWASKRPHDRRTCISTNKGWSLSKYNMHLTVLGDPVRPSDFECSGSKPLCVKTRPYY
jgi:hypothetical protein